MTVLGCEQSRHMSIEIVTIHCEFGWFGWAVEVFEVMLTNVLHISTYLSLLNRTISVHIFIDSQIYKHV